ncbi:MAG: acylphosphatase [Lachnospiraceae bacterium]|nr:acylphosphatase [Lachnospiraceae bacterium]
MCRYRVLFSGRVQKVGFRLEVCELAVRLGLTGFCKNLENGDVLAEFQGTEEKINFLISFMESLKRIRITNKVMEKLEVDEGLTGFVKG